MGELQQSVQQVLGLVITGSVRGGCRVVDGLHEPTKTRQLRRGLLAEQRQVRQHLTGPCPPFGGVEQVQAERGQRAVKVRLTDGDVAQLVGDEARADLFERGLVGDGQDDDVDRWLVVGGGEPRRREGLACGVRELGGQQAKRQVGPHHEVVVEAVGAGQVRANRNRARLSPWSTCPVEV